MAKQTKTLQDLFLDTLKDIYYAENKILKTLPKMAKAAQSKELRSAFLKHERETVGQVKRLDRVFKLVGKPARGKACEAINGITAEGAEIMKEYKNMPALDAGLFMSVAKGHQPTFCKIFDLFRRSDGAFASTHSPSTIPRILWASTSISKGFAMICIPLSRCPLATTAFSA
jgi:Domain of unknown function (DUF892)